LLLETSYDFPLAVTSKGLMLEDITIKGDKNTGMFIMKNPSNTDKLNLVIFWQNTKPYYFNPQWDNSTQYVIRTEKGIEIRSNF
jgi:hypothetical protein